MAGSYPDLLGHRMLIDIDGTVGHTIVPSSDGTLLRLEMDPSDLVLLNNESSDALPITTDVQQYLFAFPDLRDLDGLYLAFVQTGSVDWIDVKVEGSSDTYNGYDGTWSTIYATDRVTDGSSTSLWSHTAPGDYRRYIQTISPVTRLRAIRIVVTPQNPGDTAWTLHSVHMYGAISAGQNPHRVEIGDPVLNQRVAPGYLDWGDVPASSSANKTFRVRNLSPSKQAENIELSVDALTDGDPSVAAQHLLSYGNAPYAATVTIPSIKPNSRSGLVTLRRVTPSDAQVGGPWAMRLRALPGFWTDIT